MTLNSSDSRVSYDGDGDGMMGTISFPVTFKFLDDTDLVVLLVDDDTGAETTWTLNTQYTLSGVGNDNGGTLTVSTSPTDYTPLVGQTLVIYRDPARTQPASLPLGGPFPSTTVEAMADRATMIAQRNADIVTRSLRQPDGDKENIAAIPAKVTRASKYMAFDAEGDPIASPAPEGGNPVSAFGATLIDDADAAAARATLGLNGADEVLTGGDLSDDAIDLTRIAAGSTAAPIPFGQGLVNGQMVATVNSGALTVTIKGNQPGAATEIGEDNPFFYMARSATLSNGRTSNNKETIAPSLTLSSGSTLGTTSGVPFRLWFLMFSELGGIPVLGVINCLSGTNIFPLGAYGSGIASASAEGGASGADSAHTIYASTAIASRNFAVIGYLEWSSGLTAAGTWDALPNVIQPLTPQTPLPGAVVQRAYHASGALGADKGSTGTALIFNDDTIPQDSEGDLYLSQAITPTSPANALRIQSQLCFANSNGAGTIMQAALFQDGDANALAAVTSRIGAGIQESPFNLLHQIQAKTSSLITFRVRAGGNFVTTTVNGASGARLLGGVMNSYLEIQELMA